MGERIKILLPSIIGTISMGLQMLLDLPSYTLPVGFWIFFVSAIIQIYILFYELNKTKDGRSDVLFGGVTYPLLPVTQTKTELSENLNTTSVVKTSTRNFLGAYQFAVIDFKNVSKLPFGESTARDVSAIIEYYSDSKFENKILGEMFGRWWNKPEEADIFNDLLTVDIKPNEVPVKLVVSMKKAREETIYGFNLQNHVGDFDKHCLGKGDFFIKVFLKGLFLNKKEFRFMVTIKDGGLLLTPAT